MVKLSIYEYKDYKKFLIDWMEQAPQKGRGMRKQLAEAISCQTAFITHVLSGDYHLSLEQAEASARWMGLNEQESEFLLLLVMHQRAGTKSLENLLRRQISERRDQQAVLKKRVNIQESLTLEDQATYYGSWHYAAIHMALLNPSLRTIEGLQKYFQLPPAKLMSVLDFLVARGLVKQEKGLFKVAQPVLHLELNSPLLTQHHTHWRLKAIDSIGTKSFENLHYSGVISLSKEDYEWVRERLSHLLKDVVDKLKDSPDEQLACLNFDWFQI
ncbi:MAG: TIGR02147 family protein [Bdellovibrio sp.]|nr:TIGR02147 family protein [Bdellovibrio sp.]